VATIALLLIFPGLFCAFFITRAYAEIDEKFITEWAAAHALDLTPTNRPMVWWYLRNARVLRTIGVLAGLLLVPFMTGSLGFSFGNPPAFAFIGYLLGALYAELSMTRPRAGKAVASLHPRELTDYLFPRLLLAQRLVGALAFLGGVALLVLGRRVYRFGPDARFTTTLDHTSGRLMFAMGVAALVGAFVLERLQRWVVQRPQPVMSAELVAADDAIRSQAVHSLGGSGLALELLALAYICVHLQNTGVRILQSFMWLPAVSGFLLSIYACLYFGHRAWRVRRPFSAKVVAE
jgi:hypothetical protein